MSNTSLSTLTDRDLLLNLYVSVIMAIEMTDTDPDACDQQLLRADAEPSVTDHTATLSEIMAEVEARLGIDETSWDETNEALH
ncbi:MAG: hypothetical protein ACK4MS_10510 [Paracoccaceae bacterium]